MKKIYKVLAGVCLAGALCAGAFAITGCGWQTETVEGEYHYVNYGTNYGVKVNVEVQSDEKGDRIRSVTIVDSEYTQLSPSWDESKKQNYLSNEQSLLNSYRGMYVADVLAMKADTRANGEPSGVSDDSVLISGATQSSGRLLLAVQDALLNFGGYKVSEGEYHYPNAWDATAPHYGIRVRVVVKGEFIAKVAVLDSNYTEVSSSWTEKDKWLDGLDGLLNAYVGKSISDVMNVNVGISSQTPGQPESVSDSSLVITGATQGSGRLVLAVQAALKSINEEITGITDTYRGEYSYSKYNTNYGIVVNVNMTGDKIHSVSILDSDYVEVTDSWDDKQLWLDGIDNLLRAYEGRTALDILTTSVTVGDDGVPSEISDSSLMITGATQGSGRLLLAVQNALEEAGGYTVYSGDYHYPNSHNPSSPEYGIAVNVLVKDETIVEVKIADSDYVEVTDSWGNKDVWNNGIAGLLEAYKGRTIAEILAVDVTTANSVPSAVSDSSLMITGATQGSGRLLLAVQNAFSGLGYEVYEGEYHYPNAWDPTAPEYGIAVKVVVKDGVIEAVGIANSDYVEVTDSWTNKDVWNNGIAGLLEAYKGRTIAEILATDVTTTNSVPSKVSDSSLTITGATQGSGRLLLAVQNAFSGLGYEVYEGEYHYPNAWDPTAPEYGIAVKVVVKDGVIEAVGIANSDYVEVTDSWTNKEIWNNGIADLLKAYKGKTIAEILAVDVTTANSVPSKVSDSSLMITGATQGSGRLLLAVQDALSGLGYEVYEGEYHYPNAWDSTAPDYGIAVRVVLNGNVVEAVGIANSDYVEVTDSWTNKDIWNNGIADLLKAYKGKTVEELLAVTVTTNDSIPSSVSDASLVITGATQGSGRLLLAVQNALVAKFYEGWNATSMIELADTTFTVEGSTVTYDIVTKGNGRAGSFEIKVAVTDGKIDTYEIVIDGSTASRYTDKIFTGFVGKDAAFFASIIGENGEIGTNDNYVSNNITTGATKSNYLCLSAALFATSNYNLALANA